MKKQFVTLGVLSAVLLFAPSVFAQANGADNSLKEDRKQLREQIKEDRCVVIENRIDARIKLYDENKPLREKIYGEIKDRVSNLVTVFKSKGYDTTKLEEDLKTWDTMTQKLWTDRALFIAALGDAKTASCGAGDGVFKTKFQTAKDLLKNVQADADAIRGYFKNTIKVDVQNVRAQKDNK